MKLLKILITTAAMVVAASASATLVVGSSLQNGINGLYTAAGTNTNLAPDVNADQLNEGGSFYIYDTANGSRQILTLELSTRDDRNRFGIYDIYDPANRLQLFGIGVDEGDAVTLNIGQDIDGLYFQRNNNANSKTYFQSEQFGFYLLSAANLTGNALTTTYSGAHLNAGGVDSFIAFAGDGDKITLPTENAVSAAWGEHSFLLAFDTALDDVRDFDDFVVYATQMAVPEPGVLALLGLGLAGVAAASRRRQKQA